MREYGSRVGLSLLVPPTAISCFFPLSSYPQARISAETSSSHDETQAEARPP